MVCTVTHCHAFVQAQQALHCINLESVKSERMTVHTIVITPTSGLYRLCRYVQSTILLSPTSVFLAAKPGNLQETYFVCKVERIYIYSVKVF